MSSDKAYYLLASCAMGVSRVIIRFCQSSRILPSSNRRSIAGEIAARLHLIHDCHKSLPQYCIDSDIDQLSRNLLKSLAEICVWPQRFTVLQATLVPQCFKCIVDLLAAKDHSALKESLIAFFNGKQTESRLKEFNEDCTELHNKLILNGVDKTEGVPNSIQRFDKDELSAHFNDVFFDTLQHHSECNPNLHGMQVDDPLCQDLRHSARLCLTNDTVSLDILIASWNMTLWQEFRLEIQTGIEPPAECQLLSQGEFCKFLERPPSARIVLLFEPRHGFFNLNKSQVLNHDFLPGHGESLSSVLRNYHLSPKDKVILSYAMAKAYWQFYDSELVRTKWTSETIWFMPKDNGSGSSDELPLRSYLAFPFGNPGNPVQEVLQEPLLNHRCPRILTIGKLLLEIGLSEVLPAIIRKSQAAQVNLDHRVATGALEKLQSIVWDGLSNKAYFDNAVGYCLDSNNFVPHSYQPKHARQTTTKSISACENDKQNEIRARRETFYKNVVLPLKWLAEKGFGYHRQQATYITKKATPPPSGERTSSQPQPAAMFHSGTDVTTEWLRGLKKISADVEHLRRPHLLRRDENATPIRVAVLDTGFDYTLSAFRKDNSRTRRITHVRDFVDPNRPPTMTDTFGHGTFMTKLIMECAPSAEIVVARVAKDTTELNQNQENIAEAILWAVLECKANVVSMSFGFPCDNESISKAIHTVESDRKGSVIFLASAGNSPTEDESFPARHPSVISIHATNCNGTFAELNAIEDRNGPAVLGTFGDQIPDDICSDISSKFPKICQPGSSVATAVAAGISAVMLAYAKVLPAKLRSEGVPVHKSTRILQLLWKSKGMEVLFYKMALDRPNRRRFVNPIWFWKEMDSDLLRWNAILQCMSKFESKHSLPSG